MSEVRPSALAPVGGELWVACALKTCTLTRLGIKAGVGNSFHSARPKKIHNDMSAYCNLSGPRGN